MKRTKLFLLVLFIINASSLCISKLYGQEQPFIQFTKTGEITATQNHFLGSPSDIEILDGHVFIADQMDFKIKVFSREGAFIREMGGRGRGPGELQHITSMWKAPDGKRIHVVDYFNRKVVTFTKDGSLVEEKLLSNTQIGWPRTVHPFSDTANLILYQPLRSNKDELFHIWDKNFERHKHSFSLPANLQDEDKLKEVYRGFRMGSSLVLDSTIYFSPVFYEGKIYTRKLNTGESWSVINGVDLKGDSYELLSPNANLVNKDGEQIYDHRVMSPEGTFVFRLHNTTRSLFITREGLLAHFVEIRKNDRKELGIEIYDASGNFIGYQSYYQEGLKKDRYTIIPEYPKAIDEENRVYTINRKGERPVISIYRLRVEY